MVGLSVGGGVMVLQRFTEEMPDDERGWCILSEVCSRMEDHEASLLAAERAVEINSEATEGLFHVATALMAMARYSEAQDYFTRYQPAASRAKFMHLLACSSHSH